MNVVAGKPLTKIEIKLISHKRFDGQIVTGHNWHSFTMCNYVEINHDEHDM